MVVDHMIYNNKKWFEGNVPNYIGKKISMSKDTANAPYEMFMPGSFNGVPVENQPTTGIVIAQYQDKDTIYISLGTHYDQYLFWYKTSDLKIENGGY